MAVNCFTHRAEEEIFIKRILRGETYLYELLVRKYNATLYKIARCYGFNHEEAEGLMLASYLSAYTHLGDFELGATFKIFLCRILVHKCFSKLSYGYFIQELHEGHYPDYNKALGRSKNVFDQDKEWINVEYYKVTKYSSCTYIFATRRGVALRLSSAKSNTRVYMISLK